MGDEESTYRQWQKETLERIESDGKETKAQAKLTNGRVTKLEKFALIFITALVILTVSNPTLAGLVLKLLAI